MRSSPILFYSRTSMDEGDKDTDEIYMPDQPSTCELCKHGYLMKKEIEAQVGAHVATMEVEMEARVQAELNARLQALMEELCRHGVLPPTTPGDSSTGTNDANLGDN